MDQPQNRVFSGVQPTGNLHLGNYLGAIRNFVGLQDTHECIYCVVDMHAITVWQDPKELAANTREVAAAYIAAGIDPERHIVFNQSKVAAHAELAWILNCVARIGWLNRMTQFKDKAGKDREKASVGLYAYPVLMAADILVYRATHVPVGEDQKQHLELARDTAQKFNNDFAAPDFFPQPEPLIMGPATRVMSLRDGTKKMSKSDPSDLSRITMRDSSDDIAKKIRKAQTDPEPLPETVDGRGQSCRHLCGACGQVQGGSAGRIRGRAIFRLQTGACRSRGREIVAHHERNETPDGRQGLYRRRSRARCGTRPRHRRPRGRPRARARRIYLIVLAHA